MVAPSYPKSERVSSSGLARQVAKFKTSWAPPISLKKFSYLLGERTRGREGRKGLPPRSWCPITESGMLQPASGQRGAILSIIAIIAAACWSQ